MSEEIIFDRGGVTIGIVDDVILFNYAGMTSTANISNMIEIRSGRRFGDIHDIYYDFTKRDLMYSGRFLSVKEELCWDIMNALYEYFQKKATGIKVAIQ